jgi:hypothetical protein
VVTERISVGAATGSDTIRPARVETAAAADLDVADRLLGSFVAWLDRFGEQSHDPYDFWASSLGRKAKRLYYRHRVRGLVAVAPFVALDTLVPSSRRLVAPRRRYPIADAHFAAGFFHLAAATGDVREVARGVHFLEELERSRCAGFEEHCWGYPFGWEARSGTIEAGTPLITTVPYGYEAFELGYDATGDDTYLQAMESVAAFAFARIPETELEDGSAAAGYTPILPSSVVNASCYRGFLLAAAGLRFGRPEWMSAGERNVAFALAAQRPDGSWPYATMKDEQFIDNFHTCLVLKNLYKFGRLTDRADVLEAVRRGYAFYRASLLDDELQPIPFAVKPRLTLHRGDLYDYAEGINLATLLRDLEPEATNVLRAMLEGLAGRWALDDGHFVTKRLLIGRNTVPYHRWAQSQIFHALAFSRRSLGS